MKANLNAKVNQNYVTLNPMQGIKFVLINANEN